MKMVILLTSFACLQTAANSFGQSLTLNLTNTPLEEVFKAVRKQSGYHFIYAREQLRNTHPVTIQGKNLLLSDVLNLSFKGQPITYLIEDKYIIIQTKLVLSLSENFLLKDITGRVTNEHGEAVPGATVIVKGTDNVTVTDEHGYFRIKQVSENAIIIITSVGHQEKEVAIGAEQNLSIQLRIAVNNLDETIVKGYYTTSKRLNTGSVSKVTSAEIARQPISNPLAALQGRVPGLIITQASGLPGSNFTVEIRGRNSIQQGTEPLYVIDGVPFFSENLAQRNGVLANSSFNSINPADIESIEILKDADATAIYGSRGSNGVILITTKKGRPGKTKFDINVYTGWGKPTRTLKYMGRDQYLAMRHEAFKNDKILPSVANAPDLRAWDTTRATDWKKMLIGGTSRSSNAQMIISGGNENTTFSVSGNYYHETTLFPGGTADKKATAAFNVVHKSIDNKFRAAISTSYTRDKNNLLSQDLTQFINTSPISPAIYDSTGRLNWQENGISWGNPLALLLQEYIGTTDRLTSNFEFSYNIVRGLSIKTNIGYNNLHFSEHSIVPIASQNPASNPKGSATFGESAVRTWIAEPQMEYQRNIGKLKLETLVGATWQENKNDKSIISGNGYSSDHLLNSTIGAQSLLASKSFSEYRYQAVYGRVHLNFSSKYIVNLTGRRDGSSRFGPGKQFANFGAVGAAWVFSKEDIVQKIKFLHFGKVRLSYGITGNDQIGNYQYLDTYSGTQFQYQGQPGLRSTRLYNPDYSWEQHNKTDVAIELAFLNGKLFTEINWFQSRSDNQIIYYLLPSQAGADGVLRNFPGIVQNAGWEITVQSTNVSKPNFSWKSAANFTIARNKLVSFPDLSSSSYASSYIIGEPLNIITGYRYKGVDPATGVFVFYDKKGDETFSPSYPDDYVTIGTTNPKFYGGLSNSITLKRWQLDFLFQFVCQKGFHAIHRSFRSYGSMRNQPIDVLARWQNGGDIAPFQKFSASNSSAASRAAFAIGNSDEALTDASFIRLKNLSLSYSIKQGPVERRGFNSIRVYVQAQNLLTITSFKGPDPENQNPQNLPPLRMITAGFQFTL